MVHQPNPVEKTQHRGKGVGDWRFEECIHWCRRHLSVVTLCSALCLGDMNKSINTAENSWVDVNDNPWSYCASLLQQVNISTKGNSW
jgi:hypothetical protein